MGRGLALMADDMTNGNETRTYHDALQAAMSERVTNMGRRINDIEVEMRTGFAAVGKSIEGLATNLSERSRPQWQALSVMLAVVVVLGGLVYWPIREATADLKASVQALAEKTITRDELDWRAARGTEDRARTEAAIGELRTLSVTRAEWMERNASRDHQIDDLQREISELKAQQAGTYGARDLLLDLRERLDRLERERPAMPMMH
jgi:hypothetical protein